MSSFRQVVAAIKCMHRYAPLLLFVIGTSVTGACSGLSHEQPHKGDVQPAAYTHDDETEAFRPDDDNDNSESDLDNAANNDDDMASPTGSNTDNDILPGDTHETDNDDSKNQKPAAIDDMWRSLGCSAGIQRAKKGDTGSCIYAVSFCSTDNDTYKCVEETILKRTGIGLWCPEACDISNPVPCENPKEECRSLLASNNTWPTTRNVVSVCLPKTCDLESFSEPSAERATLSIRRIDTGPQNSELDIQPAYLFDSIRREILLVGGYIEEINGVIEPRPFRAWVLSVDAPASGWSEVAVTSNILNDNWQTPRAISLNNHQWIVVGGTRVQYGYSTRPTLSSQVFLATRRDEGVFISDLTQSCNPDKHILGPEGIEIIDPYGEAFQVIWPGLDVKYPREGFGITTNSKASAADKSFCAIDTFTVADSFPGMQGATMVRVDASTSEFLIMGGYGRLPNGMYLFPSLYSYRGVFEQDNAKWSLKTNVIQPAGAQPPPRGGAAVLHHPSSPLMYFVSGMDCAPGCKRVRLADSFAISTTPPFRHVNVSVSPTPESEEIEINRKAVFYDSIVGGWWALAHPPAKSTTPILYLIQPTL